MPHLQVRISTLLRRQQLLHGLLGACRACAPHVLASGAQVGRLRRFLRCMVQTAILSWMVVLPAALGHAQPASNSSAAYQVYTHFRWEPLD